jgi:hypothetical protein
VDFLEEEKFAEAETLLANIEEKYTDTPWFASYRGAVEAAQAKAKAGVYEAEAEKLYADAAELFGKEQFFDVKPVVEKLENEYADSVAVTDPTRQPSFAEMEKAVGDLGRFITVRQDGKGDFTSIQEAIDDAPPNSLIEIGDSGPYGEKLVIPEGKEGLTIRGKEGFLPLITSFGKEPDFAVYLVQVEAQGTTLERLVLVHASATGGNARCLFAQAGPLRLRSVFVFLQQSAEGLYWDIMSDADCDIEDSLILANTTLSAGRFRLNNCILLGARTSCSSRGDVGIGEVLFCTIQFNKLVSLSKTGRNDVNLVGKRNVVSDSVATPGSRQAAWFRKLARWSR